MTDERQPTGLGVALRDPYPWDELQALARTGEVLGYRALFLPEIGSRDTLATVTGLARGTSRLLMGSGVAPLPARSTKLLAMAAATAQEASGGRLLLGLGTGPSGPGALDRLRETVRELRALLSSGDLGLDLRPPPIWVAALGPRAVRLAGEVADGVLLNWCTPERVARARAELAEGAAVVGRDPDEVAIGVYVRVALGASAAAALRAAAAEYAAYPAYGRQFAAMGIDPADPDAIVGAVCLSDPGTGRERLHAYREAGAHLPVVYPVVARAPDAGAAREALGAFAP